MGSLDTLKFKVWDDTSAVVSLIKKWKPRGCKSEKDYEKSLYEFLHAELGNVLITKQFARGRLHADIVVGNKVIIEFKHKLRSTAEYHRLLGQMMEYTEWEGSVIIVLSGESEANLKKELKRRAAKLDGLWSNSILMDRRIIVLEK